MLTSHDDGGNVGDVGSAAPAPPLNAGARLGRYLIIERVGSGAMGVVYGAYDPELDRKVALKLLKGDHAGQDETARARLVREAKAMARLSHPNVIAVHDVGVFDGQVFLAMEFLGGGTLRSWLAARRRGWRELLAVFAAAGRGLMAAHAAGLVHRDFKPENVLLDREGRPRVVDFGLAREAKDGAGDGAPAPAPVPVAAATSGTRLDTLTRTGALLGTPAYMAPEQFMGEPTDERTDQFSFCVALYEALYGERPFTSESVFRLLHDVAEGRLLPVPDDREVPAWIRRAVLRGLKSDPAQRWPSMASLIAALEDDPAVRRRAWLLAGAGLAALVAVALGLGQMVHRRRQEVERQVGGLLRDAAASSATGRARDADARDFRRRAFAAFDAGDRLRGEELWRQARASVPEADGAYERAERAYETALVLDPARSAVREQLADLLFDHLQLARELRRAEQARALEALLARHDEGGRRRAALEAQGTLALRTAPVTATAALERYEREPATGRRVARPVATPLASGAPVKLPPGSYRLLARAPGHVDVVYPFELRGGERLEVALRLPLPGEVPRDFAYVAAGDFWFGDADENLRANFLDTVPIHRRHTGAFLIARHETTYREWIAFLTALTDDQRVRYAPRVSAPLRGSLRLRELDGGWQLAVQPTSQHYTARTGETFVYAGRSQRTRQDWLDFPVAGTAPADVERYLRWLRETGRVPGARLCDELEWERAARGADDRIYPHGDELAPDDANFDVTYGRVNSAFGPDVVGAHAVSRSPFGVDDLAGNVFELVRSSENPGGFVIRGGAYYFGAATCRITNRNSVPPTFRDVTTGIRVCAPAEEDQQ
jgi:formylglycine-generating enzyme required for sulfatase activity